MTRRSALGLLCGATGATVGCGYHTGGKAELVPKSIQTIHIPAFQSLTTRYRLVDLLPQQIEREFIVKSRFRIENDPDLADAVINGVVNSANVVPTIFDPSSGKATNVQVVVFVGYRFLERATGRLLFDRPNLLFRQNYSISVNPHQFFDEVSPALDRVARDVSRDVVTSVLESF